LNPFFESINQNYYNKTLQHNITRNKSTAETTADAEVESHSLRQYEIHRLEHLRNVGVFAHVDAGKTTVTERMLALAGIVQRAGSVDSGNTLTDFLPAERERGITIQSAAISFNWKWLNKPIESTLVPSAAATAAATAAAGNNDHEDKDEDEVTIHLIDTPGHVDFSVEVNRSVAVLDGAVLVVDAVAGVQAQTETVWRAMTGPRSMNHHQTGLEDKHSHLNKGDKYGHEPLPCIAFVNKMDKEGCNFAYAMSTLKYKLPGANPTAMQIPLYQVGKVSTAKGNNKIGANIVAVSPDDLSMNHVSNGYFVGIVDLIEMRAIIWPDVESSSVSNVEECIPDVYQLLNDNNEPIDPESQVTQIALSARHDLLVSLADVDENMEHYYLLEKEPSNYELKVALRKATLARKLLPVTTGAALRGRGVEPLLDAIADFLPSPIDRLAPALIEQEEEDLSNNSSAKRNKTKKISKNLQPASSNNAAKEKPKIQLGHSLHPSLLALAFKVVHMKNKGSGDGRVVFARVYSGKITSRDTLKVITPRVPGEKSEKPRTERVGGMLELFGGRFGNLKDGVCHSGDVCALVGLKSVVTGDTLLLNSNQGTNKKSKKKNGETNEFNMDVGENICLAGVASPKPVLTVRIEAESSEQQSKLSEVLALLVAEDPSLQVEETESATLLSGLGELHIEVVVDRMRREHNLEVWIGKPSVTYRETVTGEIETPGLVEYDRTVGATRLQAAVHLILEPVACLDATTSCMILTEPDVTIGPKARQFLGLDEDASEDELALRSDVAHALIAGCKGALKRGPLGSYGFANAKCHIVDVDAEGGVAALEALPGSLRAAASNIITSTLLENKASCSILEPSMSIEITVPTDMVGLVLSDLTSRRGTVGEVFMGDNEDQIPVHSKALIHGEVPLMEILGYANTIRSITGGEGTFTAEYKGHSTCDQHPTLNLSSYL